MRDPAKFPHDPATRHADERLMTPPDQSGAARSDSMWRTPVEDVLDLHDADRDHLEEALDALEFDDAPGDMPAYAHWSDDWTDEAGWGDAARDHARSGAGSVVDFARRNPVGTALALTGVALLFAPRLERDDMRAAHARARARGQAVARRGEARLQDQAARQRDRYERGRAQLRRQLARMRAQIEDGTEDMGEEAQRRLIAARRRTLDARERALDHADRLRARAERQARAGVATAREHPVATGTLALALGAAVAAALPRTRVEDSRLGDLSDRLMREAEEIYARERDRLAGAARGAWDEARGMASETARDLRRHVPDGDDLADAAEHRVERGASRLAEGARRGAAAARGS
jgi:hypothetical protein